MALRVFWVRRVEHLRVLVPVVILNRKDKIGFHTPQDAHHGRRPPAGGANYEKYARIRETVATRAGGEERQ
jgi:hypothetical protein